MTQTETEFIYGYGRTKHILDYRETRHFRNYTEHIEIGLCGAAGNHPKPDPSRPTCKRCERAHAKRAGLEGGAK